MGNVVCDGTEFSCPFCTSKVKLSVPCSSTKGEVKKLANMGNCFHPPPGGQCMVCPSAPVPCTPATHPVLPGQSPLKIDGQPALGKDALFVCSKGGVLKVAEPGQTEVKHT